MAIRTLTAGEVGLPAFDPVVPVEGARAFDLESHARARDALAFGLAMAQPGFNIFVIGDDRAGRMTATLAFLRHRMADRPAPADWVYLPDFRHPERPRPEALPAGTGRRLRDGVADFVRDLGQGLAAAFAGEDWQKRMRTARDGLQAEVDRRLEAVRQEAAEGGLALVATPQGAVAIGLADGQDPAPSDPQKRAAMQALSERLGAHLEEINRWAGRRQAELVAWVRASERQVAERTIAALIEPLRAAFAEHAGVAAWLEAARLDMLDGLARFRAAAESGPAAVEALSRRYAVNLFVDHGDDSHAPVVLEADPTPDSLFGRIEYRQVGGSLETDPTLMRSGAVHRANGGVLVLRAEAMAADGRAWTMLKGALRDREACVSEMSGGGPVAIAGAPRPVPIPLDLKVVLVGAPRWYYAFFSIDPDFVTHFKVKADIDSDMAASPENLAVYAGLVRDMARARGAEPDAGALGRILGTASRWAWDRRRLTARFELVEDLLDEAVQVAGAERGTLTAAHLSRADADRRRRNARLEDRMQRSIADGTVTIATSGAAVAQVNALTVRDTGDHAFGMPARVTARASAGRLGVINIEREALLGGPIQQKGALVLQGFLAGRFARRLPLSFDCSITFEQSYGGVEGDSATLAEALAILSDLAAVPLRQDLAVTGSLDQRGRAQAVGGVHHKVEGFYRTCVEQGGLTGTQGVVLPRSCEPMLVLADAVAAAVAEGRFHLYSVDTVEDALEIFTGLPSGMADDDGDYPADSVYGRVVRTLARFDQLLAARDR